MKIVEQNTSENSKKDDEVEQRKHERLQKAPLQQQPRLLQQPQLLEQSQLLQQPQFVAQSELYQQPQLLQQSQFLPQSQLVPQLHFAQQPQFLQQSHFLTQPQFLQQPQFLRQPNPLFSWATSNNFLYTTPVAVPLPVLPNIPEPTTKAPKPTKASATTTERSTKQKEREPTTAKPLLNTVELTNEKFSEEPAKLQTAFKSETVQNDPRDLRNDARLLDGVRQINPNYVIEEIIAVPGRHIYSAVSTEKISERVTKLQEKSTTTKLSGVQNFEKLQKKKLKKASRPMAENSSVKVEATGKTATSGNIPQIPFGTYFLPYYLQGIVGNNADNRKVSTLILEPHSKAIVGNGGTAISRPISRAVLKKGVSTNVFFNPESVAIAGAGGKAHAQADLLLDLINRRR